MLHIVNLGSGSKGNSTWVEYGETCILVDAGFSCRQLCDRIVSIGKSPMKVAGILVTHEHSDHVSGISVFCKKYAIPVYCNARTRDVIVSCLKSKGCEVPRFTLFNNGEESIIGGIKVQAVSTSHDAVDPVAYRLRLGDFNFGLITDTGYATNLIINRFKELDALLLESNHDVELLMKSGRPWETKQRIKGKTGHLSNEQSVEFFKEIVSPRLKSLVLGHLSAECNDPRLPRKKFEAELREYFVTGACRLGVASQCTCTEIFKL